MAEAAASMVTTTEEVSIGMATVTTIEASSWVTSDMTTAGDMETGTVSVPATTSALFSANP